MNDVNENQTQRKFKEDTKFKGEEEQSYKSLKNSCLLKHWYVLPFIN